MTIRHTPKQSSESCFSTASLAWEIRKQLSPEVWFCLFAPWVEAHSVRVGLFWCIFFPHSANDHPPESPLGSKGGNVCNGRWKQMWLSLTLAREMSKQLVRRFFTDSSAVFQNGHPSTSSHWPYSRLPSWNLNHRSCSNSSLLGPCHYQLAYWSDTIYLTGHKGQRPSKNHHPGQMTKTPYEG